APRPRKYLNRRAERRSRSVLTQLVDELSHRAVVLGSLRLERSPSPDTFRWPNDRQRRPWRVERDDTTDRGSTVGQHERSPFPNGPKHTSGLVTQFTLRQTLILRLEIGRAHV